eukprot:Skav201012  [mRNA]  locus=scaffold991:320018:327556:- [translate_table: standard]
MLMKYQFLGQCRRGRITREAILAALSALPRQSLMDVLRRLAERRPEEVATAVGHLKVSTGTGALLSPHKSEMTRGTSSPSSAHSPCPQVAVAHNGLADVVAAAADAADAGAIGDTALGDLDLIRVSCCTESGY